MGLEKREKPGDEKVPGPHKDPPAAVNSSPAPRN